MVLLIIIIYGILINFVNSNKIFNALFPIFDFNLHNEPVIMLNETVLKEENEYYKEMRKITLIHAVGSSITTLVGGNIFFFIAPPLILPVTIFGGVYGGYHIYMNYKSTHIEQTTEFYLNGEKYDNRFEPTWGEYIRIPEFLFNPVIFFVLIYIFLFFIYFKNKQSISRILYYIPFILLFVYTFSFLQSIKESNIITREMRVIKRREIKHECHCLRISFWGKVKLYWFSFFSIQTDKLGYYINEKCTKLELELYAINEPLINILYRTFTRSILVIVNEILNSISLVNKLFFFALTTIIIFIYHIYFKKHGTKKI